MLEVKIHLPSSAASKTEGNPVGRSGQMFKLQLEDYEVGKMIKTFVELSPGAKELTLDFVNRRWHSR